MSTRRRATPTHPGPEDPRTLKIQIAANAQERKAAGLLAERLELPSPGVLGRLLFRVLGIAQGIGPAPSPNELEELAPVQRALAKPPAPKKARDDARPCPGSGQLVFKNATPPFRCPFCGALVGRQVRDDGLHQLEEHSLERGGADVEG